MSDNSTLTIKQTIEVTTQIPMRWLNMFFKMKSAQELMPIFPNPKEVTESLGCFGAIRKLIGTDMFGDNEITCLVPGDGVQPRTGATIACLTNWNVISVDPLMRIEGKNPTFKKGRYHEWQVNGLTCVKDKVENIETISAKTIIIVCVHSHAKIQDCVDRCDPQDRLIIVGLPCCVPYPETKKDGFVITRTRDYIDKHILTPKNRVLVWDMKKI